ncbi:Membrane alanine aminopeptidase N [hydrothermal vent metagenome]|uniref:Membrane alanine aminopeptidase N n=1 Tax=hydrothermal vent metagenome TaxID=652676 RepID=A0A3B1BA61_9ZZZZ
MTELEKTEAELSSPTSPKITYLSEYKKPDYRLDSVELHFDLHETRTRVYSRLLFKRAPEADTQAPLKLDGSHLELQSVKLNGKALAPDSYTLDDDGLVIGNPGQSFELEVETQINPQANTALEGLYLSSGMFCTQCEAQGFRRITYFPDRPDVMSRYSVTVVADKEKYPVLLCNGNKREAGELDDGRHWVKWQDPSLKPSYLFALVAGDLACQEDSFTTMSGRDVKLQLFTEAENIHKCDHALISLKQAMKWDEDSYGREYDLDIYMIVAVNDFNMGAMENKGLNVFNASCVLASPETATDQDYYRIQSIIAHEYFHNWSGNRVTCRDWFQLSLKEGFTVFRDQEFSADLNSRAVQRIDDVNVLRAHQFAEDAGPMAHPVRPDHYIEISNFYTVTVYNKGAEVVRMLCNILGREGFRKGTDLYFSRHDGQAVTTDDFVKALEDANGIELDQFRNWYSQAGTPELLVGETYDAEAQKYSLTIRQHCPPTPGQAEKKPFHIPLAIGLIGNSGKQLLSIPENTKTKAAKPEHMLALTKSEQHWTFSGVEEKPVLSLGRGFTAPVKISLPHDDEALAFLFAHDTDEFNRWDAGQKLAINIMLKLIDDYQADKDLKLQPMFIEAYRSTLNNRALDKALVARALSLPSESYLADQCEIVDVDAIHAVREFMRQQLAEALADDWLRGYAENKVNIAYRFNAQDMARRSLKNLCLSYLLELDKDEYRQHCLSQFYQGNNMTDVLAALSILSQHDIAERQSVLDDFYDKWKHDRQVVEKWFAIQAASSLSGALKRVQTLMQHPAFSIRNPNLVRSLIGRFCTANPVNFHLSDGSGYRFLADQVLLLDEINPQIAARLLQSLSRWRRFDAVRQILMREQLERIAGHSNLSKDVYEIASRSLEG